MAKSKLDKLLTSLESKYVVKKAKDYKGEKRIRTGIFPLDAVLSGGISECLGGHRLEFFGGESSCKTTFALKVIKKWQEYGKSCVYIDGENSFDAEWAEILGIDTENLLVLQPSSLQELGDIFPQIIPEVDLIVIDSIVSFIPEEEIDRDTNEPTMALQARVNALITRKLYKAVADRNVTMIFINQLREKVGQLYGNPHTTGGGRALKHFYNTRIEFRAGKPIDVGSGDKKERIGTEIHLKAVKNKRGVPYKTSICKFYYDGTIDNKEGIFFSALKHDIIQLSGKSYSYGKTTIVGKQKFLDEFDKWDEVESKLWEVMK